MKRMNFFILIFGEIIRFLYRKFEITEENNNWILELYGRRRKERILYRTQTTEVLGSREIFDNRLDLHIEHIVRGVLRRED